MNRLSEHISYLLTRHDCVVVPGWGAFIAARIPAAFDAAVGRFMPPRRELTFNASISGQDGLLATSVSRREGVAYAKAVSLLAADVDALRHQLELDGQVWLPRIGRFTPSGGDATPVFEPAPDNIANSCYAPLRSVETVKTEAETPAVVVNVPSVAAPRPRRRRVPAFVRIAAAVAVLLGAGFAAGVSDRFDSRSESVDFASMSPASANRPSHLVTDDVQASTELYVAIPRDSDATSAVDPAVIKTAAQTVAAADDTAPAYCLVVASLANERQARKFMAHSGDRSLRLLVSGRRYRVYAAGASTFEGALAIRERVAARYPDVWVCAR